MGQPAQRSIALQGAFWTILGLAFGPAFAKGTGNTTRAEGSMDDGSVALVIICLILISLVICAISFHYCNFKAHEKYQKIEKENELVEVDLYESD